MRIYRNFLILILIFFLQLTSAAQTTSASNYTEDLDTFFMKVDSTYTFLDVKGIREDWDITKRRLKDKVRTCDTDEAFLGLLIQALKCLRDGHVNLIPRQGLKIPRRSVHYYPGISFLPATNDRVIVMSAVAKLDSILPPGTVITKIDGHDARRYLEERSGEAWQTGCFFSSPQRARLQEYRVPLSTETKGEKHTLAIKIDGKEKDVEVVSDLLVRGMSRGYNMPQDLAQSARSCFYTRLPSDIGYMYIRRMDRGVSAGMDSAFAARPDVRGWIIDIRENSGGGYTPEFYDRIRDFPQPIACIIGAATTSAGETFARDLHRLAGAHLFGQRTAGSSSEKCSFILPSGIATVQFSKHSRIGLNGQPIEFNGIVPEVLVEAVPEEIARGLNSEIARAEAYLLEQTEH